ncbi:MAG: Zn-dependent exopeptidase M28 [Peptococcaceae bacterium]|jgi:aminopeptidase YwaD|nr:Zn-dependent exopeptidase M28 [Peptococcaceae bacterium]
MKSRRLFLKIFTGAAAALIPWVVMPETWQKGLKKLLGQPTAELTWALNGDSANSAAIDPKVLQRKAFDDIEFLSSPEMQGRRAGTAAETRALVYLEEQLRNLHLEPLQADEYWQIFSIPVMQERLINGRALFRPNPTEKMKIPASNIFGVLPGKNPEKSIMLCAHYDHLGIYKGELYPGANDNASGVGCVLEVMRRLVADYHNGNRPQVNIIAAFWSAEEMGFLGSIHFVKNSGIPLSSLQAVLNLDTVANGSPAEFICWAAQENFLTETVRACWAQYGATVSRVSGNGHRSDEAAFDGTGVPAVTVLSKDWLVKNHTPEDDISLINPEKLEVASLALYDTVKQLAYSAEG